MGNILALLLDNLVLFGAANVPVGKGRGGCGVPGTGVHPAHIWAPENDAVQPS